MKYIRGFDGLRAVSALAVMAFHIELPGFALGWLGVHLFFVLSGFLITGLLIDAKGQDHYYSTFYTRRALRILPIYFLTLGVLLTRGSWRGWPIETWPWYFVHLQNWLLAIDHHRLPLLNHTWTLAIEEQFYLVWPLIVAIASRRRLLHICLALVLISPVCRLIGAILGSSEWPVIAPTPNFADHFAWGALGAIAIRAGTIYVQLTLRAGATAAAAAFALALYQGYAVNWDKETWRTLVGGVGFLSLIAPAFLGCLLVVIREAKLAAMLEWSALRYLGRISYGLYLYHIPVYGLTDTQLTRSALEAPFAVLAIFKFAVTIVLAVASYELIERRLIALSHALRPPRSETLNVRMIEDAPRGPRARNEPA